MLKGSTMLELLTVKGWRHCWTEVERAPPGRVVPPLGRTAWTYVCHLLPSYKSSSQSCKTEQHWLKYISNVDSVRQFWTFSTLEIFFAQSSKESTTSKISCMLFLVSGSGLTVHRPVHSCLLPLLTHRGYVRATTTGTLSGLTTPNIVTTSGSGHHSGNNWPGFQTQMTCRQNTARNQMTCQHKMS